MRHSGGGSRPGRPTTAPVDRTPNVNPSDPTGRALRDRITVRHAAATLAGWTRCANAGPPPNARPLTHPVDTSPAAVTPRDNHPDSTTLHVGNPSSAPPLDAVLATSRRRTSTWRSARPPGHSDRPAPQRHQHYGDCRSCQRLPELNRTCATPPGHDRVARRPPARRSPSRSPPPWRGAPGCWDAGRPFPRKDHCCRPDPATRPEPRR
jgi:hypothetical protein